MSTASDKLSRDRRFRELAATYISTFLPSAAVSNDEIVGLGDFSILAASAVTTRPGAALEEAHAAAQKHQQRFPVVVFPRPSLPASESYVVLTLHTFALLLKERELSRNQLVDARIGKQSTNSQ